MSCEINGLKINEGQELYVGSKIDLILGEGLKDEKVLIPNLIGLTREEANIIVKSKSINIGLKFIQILFWILIAQLSINRSRCLKMKKVLLK